MKAERLENPAQQVPIESFKGSIEEIRETEEEYAPNSGFYSMDCSDRKAVERFFSSAKVNSPFKRPLELPFESKEELPPIPSTRIRPFEKKSEETKQLVSTPEAKSLDFIVPECPEIPSSELEEKRNQEQKMNLRRSKFGFSNIQALSLGQPADFSTALCVKNSACPQPPALQPPRPPTISRQSAAQLSAAKSRASPSCLASNQKPGQSTSITQSFDRAISGRQFRTLESSNSKNDRSRSPQTGKPNFASSDKKLKIESKKANQENFVANNEDQYSSNPLVGQKLLLFPRCQEFLVAPGQSNKSLVIRKTEEPISSHEKGDDASPLTSSKVLREPESQAVHSSKKAGRSLKKFGRIAPVRSGPFK